MSRATEEEAMLKPTVVGLILLVSASAAGADRRVALMPIRTTNVDAALVPSLDAVLGVELAALGGYEVITAGDIESMLDFERQRDLLTCDDGCVAEIGGALGVDRIVRTHIGRLGGSFVLDMALINTVAGRAEARIYETTAGHEDELIALIRHSVARLVTQHAVEVAAETREPEPPEAPEGRGPKAAAAPEASDVASPTGTPSLGGWLTVAAGTVAIVGGAVGHHVGSQGHDEAVRITGDVAIGVGAAAALAGLFWVGLSSAGAGDGSPNRVAVAPVVGSTVGARFGLWW
jgi:hypothetical protein